MTISCCRPSAPFGPYPNVHKSKKNMHFFIFLSDIHRGAGLGYKISGKKIVKKCTNLTQKFYIFLVWGLRRKCLHPRGEGGLGIISGQLGRSPVLCLHNTGSKALRATIAFGHLRQ